MDKPCKLESSKLEKYEYRNGVLQKDSRTLKKSSSGIYDTQAAPNPNQRFDFNPEAVNSHGILGN